MTGDSKSATIRRRARRVALSLAAVALALTAAGCASSSGGSTGPVPVPAATGDPVSAQPTSLGTILSRRRGRWTLAEPQQPRGW